MTRTLENAEIKRLLSAAIFSFLFVVLEACSLRAADVAPDLDQDWLVTSGEFEESQSFAGVFGIGRVTYVDGKGFDTEDRVAGTERRYARLSGTAVILKRTVDSERIQELCRQVRSMRSVDDHVWLSNGDDFSCEVLGMNKRFVYLRAFDVEMATPRGKVAAIRFRDVQKSSTD